MWSRKLYDTDKANQSLILSADLDFEVLTETPQTKCPNVLRLLYRAAISTHLRTPMRQGKSL
jgi:hypothetical protein